MLCHPVPSLTLPFSLQLRQRQFAAAVLVPGALGDVQARSLSASTPRSHTRRRSIPLPFSIYSQKLLSQNLVSEEEATAIEAMVMLMLLLLLLLLLLFTAFVMLMILVLILTWCSGEEDVR